MAVVFGRDICGDVAQASEREWLVTNGIGGFAMGTISGELTRRYHGLLIAALHPPLGRTLLAAKLDEMALYADSSYDLSTNRWVGGLGAAGHRLIERFSLDGRIAVWRYALADALLEKRVWMQQDANTTYVRYTLRRGSGPLALRLAALVTHRDYHGFTRARLLGLAVDAVPHGLRVQGDAAHGPFYLLSDGAAAQPVSEWRRGLWYAAEADRGQEPMEDLLHAGDFSATLRAGESLTMVLSTEAAPSLDGAAALAERQAYERGIVAASPGAAADVALAELTLAADQFVVRRPLADDAEGRSVIAGYPWFSDWGRDTMIALPGLTLATGRPEVASRILRTFARFVDQGMIPNRFPDAGEVPEYNTVDATLWYVEAIRAYHEATGDDALLRDLLPAVEEIIAWHRRGTRYQIHVDPTDGLIYAGEPGVQLTWMDAKFLDWVVTPRIGKPVEINALWYNTLLAAAGFARALGRDAAAYEVDAERVRASFGRFWNAAGGCCYDVIDGPDGVDPSVRPNQIFAVSLPHSPLDAGKQRAVVDACARELVTSHGLRSLTPSDAAYVGGYRGNLELRDGSYHQGAVWGWLIGPFVRAHLRAYGDAATARSFLEPMVGHLLHGGGVGSISEIFDGDAPHAPRGCPQQAWSVAEVLRAWRETAA
ncbi:glycogen debranching protein [Chloroflexia bacterium SDU3-3]|nr:glycogen debranching protein [Chloroflexia bacterium SDU3-3]